MIYRLFLWLFPLLLVAFDKSFFDIIVVFPLFFYIESLNDFTFEKALRFITYLSIYVFVNYHEFSFLFVVLIFIILIIDSSREYWMKIWFLPLVQSALFLIPMVFEGYFASYLISLSVFFVIFMILFEKRIIRINI
ncbi:MAG: hypothetical protein PWP54_225 [Thermosipho sp. (in: thermotogales)]|nr:hypothetical protein [Thermosipho sp. (in: thermotogales)]MDN5324500.1 hypothetical protein [Thermosipho sp. (in: thermotogales)]